MSMNTGDISRRLGTPVNTDFLVAAGLTVEETVGRATMFGEPWPTICDKIAAHVLAAKSNASVAKPPPSPKKEKADGKPAAAPKPTTTKPNAAAPAADDDWENTPASKEDGDDL